MPHACIKEVLFDTDTQEFKVFYDSEFQEEYMVSAVQMFKTGIKPAWEDKVNQNGSEFRLDLNRTMSSEKIQETWHQLVFDMVSGHMPHVKDGVAGLRLVQKAKNQTFSNFRIELWMTQGDEESQVVKDLKSYLESCIIVNILQNSAETLQIRFEPHSQKHE